jgi:hypothetical protein
VRGTSQVEDRQVLRKRGVQRGAVELEVEFELVIVDMKTEY